MPDPSPYSETILAALQVAVFERVARRLQIGVKASRKLRGLLQDILTMLRADSQRAGTGPDDSVDLLECAKSVASMLGPAAALRGKRILEELRPNPNLSGTTVGELVRTERVMFNILENAIRYSPDGGTIRIALNLQDRGVEVSVEDEGPGVPEVVVPSLLKKFGQYRSRVGKAGLGLYFRNIMIPRWGGKIGYRRTRQSRSQFWFSSPVPAR